MRSPRGTIFLRGYQLRNLAEIQLPLRYYFQLLPNCHQISVISKFLTDVGLGDISPFDYHLWFHVRESKAPPLRLRERLQQKQWHRQALRCSREKRRRISTKTTTPLLLIFARAQTAIVKSGSCFHEVIKMTKKIYMEMSSVMREETVVMKDDIEVFSFSLRGTWDWFSCGDTSVGKHGRFVCKWLSIN